MGAEIGFLGIYSALFVTLRKIYEEWETATVVDLVNRADHIVFSHSPLHGN